MSVLDNIVPGVRELGAYTLAVTEAPVRLDRNESPVDLPAEARAQIAQAVLAEPWNRYPAFVPQDVLEGLGRMHGVSAEHVLIGNGSNELIQAIVTATVDRDGALYFPEPTFTLYRMMVRANDGDPRAIPLTEDLEYDEAAWRAAAERGDGHLLLCSPNNPTGTVVRPDFVRSLARTTDRLVIVDEAYAQFGPHDLSTLVNEHDNVIVLRTFSKAVGLAGVRLGYALANPALVPEISKVKLPYNVGVFGLAVARYAIAHPEVFTGIASDLVKRRAALRDALAALPFEQVLDGQANFVVVRTPHADALWRHLVDRGLLVRNIGKYPMLAHCLRITIGTEDEHAALLAATRAFFEESPS